MPTRRLAGLFLLGVDTVCRAECNSQRFASIGVGMGVRLGICIGVATALLLPLRLLAGEISGTLSQGGQPLAGAEVKLLCDKRDSIASTDKFGRYRIEIAGATGRCKLSAGGGKAVDVFLFAAPTRYDFERVGDTLRRR